MTRGAEATGGTGHGRDEPDCIRIEGLAARAIIGIFEFERDARQDLELSLELYTDLRRAAASDAIEDAIDYKRLTKRVLGFVEASRFQLIERLAEEIASLLLAEFPLDRVGVTVAKPGALRFARNVSVRIMRRRGSTC